jgi:hypothetical protein
MGDKQAAKGPRQLHRSRAGSRPRLRRLYALPANAYAVLMARGLDSKQLEKPKEYSVDAMFLLISLAFFAASAVLVYGCERLRSPS